MILETIFKCRVMKAINRLSVLFFLFIAVACSSEDDILDGVETKAPDNNIEAEAYAEFEFSLSTEATTQTRSAAIEDGVDSPSNLTTERSISSCYIAVIDEGGQIIASDFYSTYNKGDITFDKENNVSKIKKHITIKVHKGDKTPKLKFFAVANLQAKLEYDGIDLKPVEVDEDGFITCTTLQGIQDKLISKSYINIFVKQGFCEWPEGQELLSRDYMLPDDKCNSIEIPVEQVTAAVQLQEFNIRTIGADGKETVISAPNRVKSVELINVKNKTYLNQSMLVDDSEGNYDKTASRKVGDDNTYHPKYKGIGQEGNPTYESIDEIRFYAYRNETEDDNKKTALRIVYTLEDQGEEFEKIFTIKTPAGKGYTETIQAGKLYQLYVTVTQASEDVRFEVMDWKPNTLDLGEIEGIIK